MNKEILEHCKKEIHGFLEKNFIRPSKSPWSCSAFYVNNANEKEMSEELKEQIAKILLETSDEEENIEEIEEETNTSDDEEINEIECDEENCDENCICRYTINVISKELKRTLEMIDSIENPEEKFKWLTLVKNDLLKEEMRNEVSP